MRRADLLASLRVAGYHDDQRTFVRLLAENRISRKAADDAYRNGRRQKEIGIGCHCYQCSKNKKPAAPASF